MWYQQQDLGHVDKSSCFVLQDGQLSPSNQQEMKNNVEKVLQFVASKKIRMHQTSAKGQCFLLSVVAEYTHLYLGITTFRRTIRSVAEGSE